MTDTSRSLPAAIAAVAFAALSAAVAWGQDREPLRLQSVAPEGVRNSTTESWTTLRVTVRNLAPEGRDARVLAFYTKRPDVQYGRDLWVPGRSELESWMLVGPAPEEPSGQLRGL